MPKDLEIAIIKNDHMNVHQRLYEFDPDPYNSVNEALQTGLMIACQHKSVETVKVFLRNSTPFKNDDRSFCNVNLVDDSGWTALHYAVQSGSLECVKLLIDHEAEIDSTTDKKETALFLATKCNYPDIVDFLAEINCKLQTKALCKKHEENSEEETLTALEFAVAKNFAEITKCLLLHLSKLNELNEKELGKLLVEAAGRGHTQIANELLSNGVQVYPPKGTFSFF
jgi:ankyrin repeat protein